jgi:hypothetical protein
MTQYFSSFFDREVVLPEMNAIRIGQQCNINPIIDDSSQTILTTKQNQRLSGFEKCLGAGFFFAELYPTYSGFGKNFEKRLQWFRSELGIEDDVKLRRRHKGPTLNLN